MHTEVDFKVGDKVKVHHGHPGLPIGSIHTVQDIYERNGDVYVSLSVDGKDNRDGWDIDRFTKYEEKENTLKIDMQKKYRMVGTHEPMRIICVDRVDPDLPCVGLYMSRGGFEGVQCFHPNDGTVEEVPEVDWSKVQVDTLIWVDGVPHYFANSSEHYVYFFQDGRTSKTNSWPTRRWAHKSNCSLEEPK